MITLDTKFKPSSLDPDAIGRAATAAALNRIKQLEKIAQEITDPQTGEHPKISWSVTEEGVKVSVHGSPFVLAEMQKRISTLPA